MSPKLKAHLIALGWAVVVCTAHQYGLPIAAAAIAYTNGEALDLDPDLPAFLRCPTYEG